MQTISADFEKNNTALSNSIITSQNIEDMDVVINTGLAPLELFKENDALQNYSSPIIIQVPSDNVLFQISTADQTPDMDYILPDMDNYLSPAMESILENSINSDPEYRDPIKNVEGGRKRIILNKRKKKKLRRINYQIIIY